jgi:4-oxalmesaconate hydratase
MIIDCHGHYTTAPQQLEDYRNRQIAELKDEIRALNRSIIRGKE